MLQVCVTFLSKRMRHYVYDGSCMVCPIFLSVAASLRIEIRISKYRGMKRNMQPLFVVALVLQQHRPSNSKAIAYRQIFQQYKGKLIDFMLIYYTVSLVLQV